MKRFLDFVPLGLVFLLTLGLLGMGITREVPHGTIRGVVTMEENRNPLPGAEVYLMQSVVGGQNISRRLRTRSDGTFSARVPVGVYTIEFSARAHEAQPLTISVAEGRTQEAEVVMKPMPPYLNLYASNRVFSPGEEPTLEVSGFAPQPNLDVSILPLDLRRMAAGGQSYANLTGLIRMSRGATKGALANLLAKDPTTIEIPITQRDAEGVFTQRIKLPALEAGAYVVKTTMGHLEQHQFISVSRFGVVVKSASDRRIAFASGLDDGAPVRATYRWIPVGGEARSIVGSPDGMAELPPVGSGVLLAESGGSLALIGVGAPQSTAGGIRTVGYTDRPVYRPGDLVSFKVIARSVQNRALSVVRPEGITAEVRDPQDVLIARTSVSFGEFGSGAGEVQLNRNAEPGLYFVALRDATGNRGTFSFEVDAYRKPDYTLAITPVKPRFFADEPVQFKVKAEYYFGGPVVGAELTVYPNKNPIYRLFEGQDEDLEEEFGGYGEYLDEIELTTDANGEAIITVRPTKDSDRMDYRITVDVTMREGDRYIQGAGGVNVYQGNLSVVAEPESYVLPAGSPAKFLIEATDLDGKAPTNREAVVKYGTRQWTDDGMTKQEIVGSVTTQLRGGVAIVEVPAGKAGNLTIWVEVKDDQGRTVVRESEVWLGTFDGMGPGAASLEIKLDKRRYASDDTALALVRTSQPGGSALVTLESDRIHWSKVIDLSTGVATVEVPVLDAMVPVANLSVVRTFKRNLSTDQVGIPISYGPRELKVQVEPLRAKVQPGEEVDYRITVTGPDGQPARAEVSVGVVDGAIYAVRRDRFNLLKELYPTQYSSVRLEYSYAQIYLDGGDKGGEIPIRSNFKDTAAWMPQLEVDGTRVVRVKLPDNLTTWRATVIAVDTESRAGQATAEVVASKPLLVRVQLPRTLVEGDEIELKTIVNAEQPMEAEVVLRPDGLELSGESSRRVRIGDRPVELSWRVRATKSGTWAPTATVRQLGGDLSDGVENRITVRPAGAFYTESQSVRIVEEAQLPGASQSDAQLVSRKVSFTASLASGMLQSLDELIDFPYGCVEQTMSRFLPAVLVGQILRDVPFERKELIPQIAAEGVARLRQMQQPQGGWGWWEYDQVNAFMTAFVLDGLAQARQAGVFVPDYTLERAREFLAGLSPDQLAEMEDGDRWYLAFSARQLGWTEEQTKIATGIDSSKADSRELAFAYLATGDRSYLDRLRGNIQSAGDVAFFRSEKEWWGSEATSVALRAFAAADPTDPLVARLANYLMQSRRARGWASTRDTCFAISALARVARDEPFGEDREVILTEGDREVGRALIPAPGFTAHPELDLPRGSTLARVSGGQVYAKISEEYFDSSSSSRVAQGVTVTRRYLPYRPERFEDGSERRLVSGTAQTRFRQGDLIVCEITLETKEGLEFVLIEDFFPVLCEVLERDDAYVTDWSFWWDRVVRKDDRVAFFKTDLPKGTHTFQYILRAETAGKATALGTMAGNMYSGLRPAMGKRDQIEVSAR